MALPALLRWTCAHLGPEGILTIPIHPLPGCLDSQAADLSQDPDGKYGLDHRWRGVWHIDATLGGPGVA